MKLQEKIVFALLAIYTLPMHSLVFSTSTMADVSMNHKRRIPKYKNIPGRVAELTDPTTITDAEDIETPSNN